MRFIQYLITTLLTLAPLGIFSMMTSCIDHAQFTGGSPKKAKTPPQTEWIRDLFVQESASKQQQNISLPAQRSDRQQLWTQQRAQLDLLVVIDDSGSMADEQQKLGEKMDVLLEQIKDVDWQIAVVTTNADTQDCFRGRIDKSDKDAAEKFKVAVGEAGAYASHGNEQGLSNSLRGLKGECQGQTPWLRDQSAVAVIIVSDEDNCSYGASPYCTLKQRKEQVEQVKAYASQIRRPGENMRYYAIIHQPQATRCEQQTDENRQFGFYYDEVVRHFNGMSGSICAHDYTPILETMSHDLAQLTLDHVVLEDPPVEGSVQVSVDSQPWPQVEMTNIDNHLQVVFTELPPEGARIEVKYQTLMSGILEESVALTTIPDPQTLVVTVAGKPMARQSWRFDQDSQSIIISRSASETFEFQVNYDTPYQLQSQWSLTRIPFSDLITEIQVDGVVQKPEHWQYDEGQNLIVLDAPPVAGAQILVRYQAEIIDM